MPNLLIASKYKDYLSPWVDAFSDVYSCVVLENIDDIFSGEYDDEKILLIIDAAYIENIEQIGHICEYIKKVVVVGEGVNESLQIQFILSGASGYSDKSVDKAVILRAIAGVLNDEIWLERQVIPRLLKNIVEKNKFSKGNKEFNYEEYKLLSILTRREIEVIDLVYKGTSNSDIAEVLKISNRTVKAHLSAIYRKLNVSDRFQLIILLKNLHVAHLAEDFLDV